MAGLRIYLFFLALFLMNAATCFGNAIFHDGSTGSCQGCHTDPPQLIMSDAGSTCLRCHSGAGSSQNVKSPDGSSFTPGGDFYWLGKTFTWTGGFGGSMTSPGRSHGHNVIALDFGLSADEVLTMAPGSTYPSGSLSCISCHDPHAVTGGSYRLLGGADYNAGMPGFSFLNPAPSAVAPANWTETDSNHVSYVTGFSEWCTNCHAAFLSCVLDMNALHHPACQRAFLGDVIANNYNIYISSGNLTGSVSVAYRALVPFESGNNNAPPAPSSTAGPGATANVMCLSCHRAHASAFRNIGRWDFQAVMFKDSHPNGAGDGSTYSDKLNSYYGRTFEDFQRQLCNKCHIRD